MKTALNKALLTVGLATALSVASTNVLAVVFPDFTVDATAFGSSGPAFTADKVTGNYDEWITFSPGVFNVSVLWNAGQFVKNDGSSFIPAGGPSGTGLNATYGMYALFQGSGSFTPGPTSTFSLASGGSLTLWLDPNLDTLFVDPAGPQQGMSPYTTISGIGVDDILLATGTGLSGSGTLNTTCSGGINCGSFGQTTSLALTSAGSSFFINPAPLFYNLAFQSGQFNNFALTGTQNINGSLDLVFGQVPEPATLGLLGLGLLGMGAVARRRKAT